MLELAARGSINGLQPTGISNQFDGQVVTWGASTINVSDANPNAIPGIATPFTYQSVVGIGDCPGAGHRRHLPVFHRRSV